MQQNQLSSGGNSHERGAALLLALILTMVLTFLGLGLLTRSLLVSRIAGSQRWSIKALYAADAGINLAKARLKIRRTEPFLFALADARPATDSARLERFGAIEVAVSELSPVGSPQPAIGTQIGGGQGGGTPLYLLSYRGTATAKQELTRTERVVSSTMTIGPVPLAPRTTAGGGV